MTFKEWMRSLDPQKKAEIDASADKAERQRDADEAEIFDGKQPMKNETAIRIMKTSLSYFIEDLIQSENGPSEEDIKYIAAERERIRQMQFA